MDGIFGFVVSRAAFFWLFVAVAMFVVEGMTFSLTTIWFGCGAFAMIFVSFLGFPFGVQFLVFIAISSALLVSTRGFVAKKLAVRHVATNSDSIVGKKVRLATGITAAEKGSVRINGVVWSVTSGDGSEIAQGTECVVDEIRGATLVVSRAQEG